MITVRQKGDFSKTTKFLERVREAVNLGLLDKYGREGVNALKSATPVDTGLTASSWYYEIENRNGVARLTFNNSKRSSDSHYSSVWSWNKKWRLGTGSRLYQSCAKASF